MLEGLFEDVLRIAFNQSAFVYSYAEHLSKTAWEITGEHHDTMDKIAEATMAIQEESPRRGAKCSCLVGSWKSLRTAEAVWQVCEMGRRLFQCVRQNEDSEANCKGDCAEGLSSGPMECTQARKTFPIWAPPAKRQDAPHEIQFHFPNDTHADAGRRVGGTAGVRRFWISRFGYRI